MPEYMFGFADRNGDPYDYHISDDLDSHVTWNGVELKFADPRAWYLFVWRRDGGEFDAFDVDRMAGFLAENMSEFMSEADPAQAGLAHELLPNRTCLVFSYGRTVSIPDVISGSSGPCGNLTRWEVFESDVYMHVLDESERVAAGRQNPYNLENVLHL